MPKSASVASYVPTEADIKAQIKDYLSVQGYWYVATGGGLFKRRGIPDIIFGGHGVWGCVEVKSPRVSATAKRGQPTLEQARELDAIKTAGGLAIVARRLEDVMGVLREGRNE